MTDYITWTPDLSVGVAGFDDDHRMLIGLLNRLFHGIQAGQGPMELEGVIESMAVYARQHFAREEHLMEKLGYPGFEAHRHEHEDLARGITDLRQKVSYGATPKLCLEALHFLRTWLSAHIMSTDRDYRAFFTAHGIR